MVRNSWPGKEFPFLGYAVIGHTSARASPAGAGNVHWPEVAAGDNIANPPAGNGSSFPLRFTDPTGRALDGTGLRRLT